MSIIEDNKAGIIVGIGAGGWKSVDLMLTHLKNLAFIPWEMVLQAGLLAFIGGALGWLGSELMNQIKRAYLKRKQRKNDKKSSD